METKRIIFNDYVDGDEWVATYHLGISEFDDLDESEPIQIIFNAVNFDMAVRYAQQYLRKMQTEEETSNEWASAEILSVELH